jgi:hypothetical protein
MIRHSKDGLTADPGQGAYGTRCTAALYSGRLHTKAQQSHSHQEIR